MKSASASMRDCLSAETSAIRAYLDKKATHKGQKFWFFKSRANHPVVTIVCHIDTVYDGKRGEFWDLAKKEWVRVPRNQIRILHDKSHDIFWSPDGLGADDRAGVYGLFWLMSNFKPEDSPNFLFCDEEETGCHGAREAAESLKEVMSNTLFFIELDRRNNSDCVFYNDEPSEFVGFIEKHGFKKDWGSVSDITYLGKAIETSAVNLSVGYYDEHTKSEFFEKKVLMETLDKTHSIIVAAHKDQMSFPNIQKKKTYAYQQGDFDWEYGYSYYSRDYKNGYNGFGGPVGRRSHYGLHKSWYPYPEEVSKNLAPTEKKSADKKPAISDEIRKYIEELRGWMTAAGY